MKEKDVNVSQKEDNVTVFSERNWNNNYNYVRNYSNYSNFFLKTDTSLSDTNLSESTVAKRRARQIFNNPSIIYPSQGRQPTPHPCRGGAGAG